jgi:thiosulfate reductase cytochrome b subunit
VDQSIKLAAYAPVLPIFDGNNNVKDSGEIIKTDDGTLYYQPTPANDKMYIFGSDRVFWIDWFGLVLFMGTILGVVVHSGLRYLSAKRHPKPALKTKHIYMYEAYERFWHWLQALGIVLLLLTGMAIHRPDLFSVFSFRVMVTTHTVLAALLVFNFLLSLFWHVVSGEIQQYVPHPYGFFDQAIAQAKYYIVGIFNHEKHPFEKTKERKFNPLQKVTYFGLLTVLMPLQGVTGILIWGTERWPAFSDAIGGLTILAPLHTLTAWLLGAFIIAVGSYCGNDHWLGRYGSRRR